jgi:hypothetical protein
MRLSLIGPEADEKDSLMSRADARFILWLLLFLGICCFSARAQSISGASLTVLGTDSFDRDNTFGWRFTPVTDIDVTALGFFDATGLPAGTGTGLSQSHEVGIYRVTDQVLVASNAIPAGIAGDLNGNFRYVTLVTPVRLAGGTTYLMAGFALSTSPDPAAFASSWTMSPGILYANSPLPTIINPTSGTSQYLVSAHGNPPAVLTYPGVAQTGLLPVFAANFQFKLVVPAPMILPLARLGTTNIVITWTAVSNAIYRVQYNAILNTTNWTDLVGDVAAAGGTASKTDSMTNTNRFYRVQVLP